MIDHEATKVLCRACPQKIILAARKIMCDKKGQEQGQEKDFPVLRESRSRYVEICNETRLLILSDYRGAHSALGLVTSNHFDPSTPRPQTLRLIRGNRY